MQEIFRRLARKTSQLLGSTWAFALAILVVVLWAAVGPWFVYSDTWQLVINTGTTIVTFLMVFLIQNTQNRDTLSLQLKLDELIRSTHRASNSMIDLDRLTDEQLAELHRNYQEICAQHSGSVQGELPGEKVKPQAS